MTTEQSIKQYVKDAGIRSLNEYDMFYAAKAEDLFMMFIDKTDYLEFESMSGDGSPEYPSHDTRCIVAAILTAATLIAPK